MKSLFYDKSIKSFVTPTVTTPRSIYTNKTQIRYKTGQLTTRRLTRKEIVPSSTNFSLHLVQAHEEMRPDLIAYKYYSNPLAYSHILAFNNIYSPLDIHQGMQIKIPDIFDIYGTDGIIQMGGVY